MPTYRRMPDGTLTDDAVAYCEAWEKEAEVVEEMFSGFKLDAYNPGFVFDNGQGVRFELPRVAIAALRNTVRFYKDSL